MQVGGRAPLALRHPARAFWLVSLAVLVADQISKSLVRVVWSSPADKSPLDALVGRFVEPSLSPYDSIPILGEYVRFVFVRNEGAAFGLLPGRQPIFIATSVIVLVVVAAYWRRARPTAWPIVVGLALITSGSLGNLIDRALLGKVTDFFDAAFIDFPVFNIADTAIFVGVTILIAWLLFGPQPEGSGEECAGEPLDEPSPPAESLQ